MLLRRENWDWSIESKKLVSWYDGWTDGVDLTCSNGVLSCHSNNTSHYFFCTFLIPPSLPHSKVTVFFKDFPFWMVTKLEKTLNLCLKGLKSEFKVGSKFMWQFAFSLVSHIIWMALKVAMLLLLILLIFDTNYKCLLMHLPHFE